MRRHGYTRRREIPDVARLKCRRCGSHFDGSTEDAGKPDNLCWRCLAFQAQARKDTP